MGVSVLTLSQGQRSYVSTTSGHSFQIVVGTVSVLTFSGVIPALLIANIDNVNRSQGWILTLLVMVWAGLRMSALWVAGRPRLFDFFVWLFCYIFMGLAPTVQMRSGLISTTTADMDSSLDVPTGLIVWAGIASYEVGRGLWMIREHRRGTSGVPARTVTRVGSGRTLLLVIAGLGASAYFISKIGFGPALGSRDAAFAARSAAWPDPAMRSTFYAAATYPLLVAAGACAQLRRSADSALARRACLAVMLGCCSVLLIIINPVASARYTFGTVAFALIVYAGAMTTIGRVRITMLGAIVGFLFLFPLADAFRTKETSVSRNGFFGEYMSNPDYDAFWQIANAFSYWIDGLVEPMRQLLGSLLFWMPRAIWPDKPMDTGILLAQYRGYTFSNLSAPMWAELLVNGGLIAVVVGFVLLGMALRSMDTRLLPSFESGGVWGIVGAVFPVYMTILLRGSLLQATGSLTVAVVCVMFLRSSPKHDEVDLQSRSTAVKVR